MSKRYPEPEDLKSRGSEYIRDIAADYLLFSDIRAVGTYLYRARHELSAYILLDEIAVNLRITGRVSQVECLASARAVKTVYTALTHHLIINRIRVGVHTFSEPVSAEILRDPRARIQGESLGTHRSRVLAANYSAGSAYRSDGLGRPLLVPVPHNRVSAGPVFLANNTWERNNNWGEDFCAEDYRLATLLDNF